MSGSGVVWFGSRLIGVAQPALIVAEIGTNHAGSLSHAFELIAAAAKAGADAVKFQKRSPKDLLTKSGYEMPYNRPFSFGDTYGRHREALELSEEEFLQLKACAEHHGLQFFTSVWDIPSLEFALRLKPPAIKIPSSELVNTPLLEAAATSNVLIFLSTGMSEWEEIDRAVDTLRSHRAPFVLFHTVSEYPTLPERTKLATITQLHTRYKTAVGYSGHDLERYTTIVSRVLGACVIEKHFTLDRSAPGPDQHVSLEPSDLALLVQEIRAVEQSISETRDHITEGETTSRAKLGKSVVVTRTIYPGERISREMLTVKSPAGGISPQEIDDLIGRTVNRVVTEDTLLLAEAVDGLQSPAVTELEELSKTSDVVSEVG